LLSLIAVTVAIGMMYRLQQNSLAGHAVLFEAANRTAFRERLAQMMGQPILHVLSHPRPEFYGLLGRRGQVATQGAFFVLPFLLLPFLWFWRQRFWALFMGSGLLASALVIRIPYFSMVFILATYAEMLQTPARYLFHWGYLLLGACFASLALLLERAYSFASSGAWFSLRQAGATGNSGLAPVWRAAPLTAAALLSGVSLVVGCLAVLGLGWLGKAATAHLDGLYLHAIAGSVISLVALRLLNRAASAEVQPSEVRRPWALLLFGTALVLPLSSIGTEPSLIAQYRNWSRQPSMSNFWAWYEASALADKMPGHLVRFIRALPPGQVLAAPYDFVFAIPVLTNQYVISCGYTLSTEVDFPVPYERARGLTPRTFPNTFSGYEERSAYSRSVVALAPIFNRHERPANTLAYVREYGVQYLVTSPSMFKRFEALRETYPMIFERVYEQDGHAVYRVNRQAFPAATL